MRRHKPAAAGLDIGAQEIWACVPAERDAQPVRAFGTFTPDLHALADWLVQCQVTTVAMESTGVYWIPIYEVLETRGLEVYLVNARHLKHVPGRKSDVQDCQWLQQLHSYGLLTASFRPAEDMRVLRAYVRQRAMLLEHRAGHIQHMQKALQQMNVQLTQVLSDITGTTGMQIIRAIVAGERAPQVLARLRHGRCQRSEAEIAKALSGHYRAEHVFALKQALALYDFSTEQVRECDRYLEQHYAAIKPTYDEPPPPLGPDPKPNSHAKNAPAFDVRACLYRLLGFDLTATEGLEASSAQVIVAEIGTDMSKWPTEKHFASWLGLAPHNDISGGKVLRSKPLKGNRRAAQALRLAAQTLGRTQTALGSYDRRLRARKGPTQAITATAHKLARMLYHVLTHRTPYQPQPQEIYEQLLRQRALRHLKRTAMRLGFTLLPHPGAA
ncbi:MAG: IS110 family transposase [Deltaproteobacteria bacterium]|nr:IS110 family transposase [Deltaproteobacteria bacterium]